MKAILLKVILPIFFIAFIASCDDPVKPAETPAPNPALLKYKSFLLTLDGMKRVNYDSTYHWDNVLKKGTWESDTSISSFSMLISSRGLNNIEDTTKNPVRVEGNSIISTFDSLAFYTESTAYHYRNIKITFDSSLTTIINCELNFRDSINLIGTTLDGQRTMERFHYRVNNGAAKSLLRQSENVFSNKGINLQGAITGFNSPIKISSEYNNGSYRIRHQKFGDLIINEQSEAKIELFE